MSKYKELMSKAVSSINEYLADINSSNNKCMSDDDKECTAVRMACLIPIDEYLSAHKNTYEWSVEDEEWLDGTTHVLLVGIQWWTSYNGDALCCMSGQIFRANVSDNVCMIEDIDNCLGNGPDLQDSSMDECIDWMRGLGQTDENYVFYTDITNCVTGEILSIPDSGYRE